MLIVDDQDGLRTWARALLESEGYRVAGEVADGSEAVGAVRRLWPDVVLPAVHLPDLDGFEVARRIAVDADPPVVVMVSSREASEFGPRMQGSGVSGFLSKADLTGDRLGALVHGRG